MPSPLQLVEEFRSEVYVGEEEEGQEESWEVESGVGRVKETTLTWMTCG